MASRIALASMAALSLTLATAHAEMPAATQPADLSLFDPARHMRTSEVRPGMTGYGLSVFSGTTIAKFDVTVISVLKNQEGPDHDIVLIRCAGQGLEHSGAIEGMSGSPIYLTDDTGRSRMIGAFALGWENNKDPIAGVRPIEEMLRVPSGKAADATPLTAKLRGGTWNTLPLFARAKPAPVPLAAGVDGTRLTKLSLPVGVAGVNDATFARLAPLLAGNGLVPLKGGATVPAEVDSKAKLEPGAAIGLPIITGDLDVSALGTVTEVIGDRLFAFGHEFNSEGAVDLPMGLGYVHTIIPANTISFKMGSLVRLDGAIHSDESTAIAGQIGPVPAMIPVRVTVRTGQRTQPATYHFNVTRHPKFTPMGISTALTSAITSNSGLPGEFSVKYAIKMGFDNGQTIDFADTATSADGASALQRDLNLPLALALHNPFGRTYPKQVEATFDVTPRVVLDEIKSATTDKLVYKPGDTASVYVSTQAYDGGTATKHLTLDLPDDLPEGDYTLGVSDADHALADATRDAPYRYQARDLNEVFGIIREACGRPSTTLYVRLASQGQGVSVGRTPLAGLPASRARVWAKSGSSDVMPFVAAMTRKFDWPTPLSGSAEVAIRVSLSPEKTPRPSADVSPALSLPPMPPPSAPGASAADH